MSNVFSLVGKNVFIRAVTHYYTGKLVEVINVSGAPVLHLETAAWVADTGRFGEALSKGTLNEVEPFPGDAFVSLGAVVDISPWLHELPTQTK